MKVPKKSNPKEWVDVCFIDLGEQKGKQIERNILDVFVGEFSFLGKTVITYTDIALTELWKSVGSNVSSMRFIEDCRVLRKHDLLLKEAIFE